MIRQRFKMRRKVKALAAEGRASALILSSLPIVMFAVVQIVVAGLLRQRLAVRYHQDRSWASAICWMMIGNLIMYKLVNFKI